MFTSYISGVGAARYPGARARDRVADAERRGGVRGEGALHGVPGDGERVREDDPARHRPHLPRARDVQEEGRHGPGVPLQCHEGLQRLRQVTKRVVIYAGL